MKCERCRENEAVVLVRVVIKGHSADSHYLCRGCLGTRRGWTNGGRSLSHELEDAPAPGVEAAQDVVCAVCGHAFASFCRSGYLGCPACYDAFAEYLENMVVALHGRRFLETDFLGSAAKSPGERKARQLRRLERLLQECLDEEMYESAALVRDRISALTASCDEPGP